MNSNTTAHTPKKENWGHLPELSTAYTIAEWIKKKPKNFLTILCPDTITVERLQNELQFFLNTSVPIIAFPDRETLPYDVFSPHSDLISERLATLAQLPALSHGILLVAINTALHYLMPTTTIKQKAFDIQVGNILSIQQFREQLTETGYYSVSQVMHPGEFAVRGSIVDVYPMGSRSAFRLDLIDDEIESIRWFDPETQRSNTPVKQIQILPTREYPLDETGIATFRQKWRSQFPGNPAHSPIYNAISQGQSFAGAEYYLPLFYESTATLFDYLPRHSHILKLDDTTAVIQHFWRDTLDRYARANIDYKRPLLPPADLFLNQSQLYESLQNFSQIQIWSQAPAKGPMAEEFGIERLPEWKIETTQQRMAIEKAALFIKDFSGRVLFITESAGRKEALMSLLHTQQVQPKVYDNWHYFLEDKNEKIGIAIAPLEKGMVASRANIAIITESDLLGTNVIQKRRRQKGRSLDSDTVIRDLAELHIGSPVVHVEYGVGRYLGLICLTVDDITEEFLHLEYAQQDKIYVPVSQLHLVHRYTGPDSDHAPLTRLGSDQWDKAKRKAAEKIRDVAAEILEIHAKRAAKMGYVYQAFENEYAAFSAQFPFELTFDQEKAILEIFSDMQSKKTMDRLVCGDVGFGKTEVAMRAAFLAVINQQQVAVLVPTTLLAQQHYQNFCDRFAEWPIKIELLSRFRTAKEQKTVIENLQNKRVDIVIGTHKLLHGDIQFHQLGLLIIDEEHRFGVQQKEALKALRADVDILTLTATPIPRTLNMAMSGIRDLSIISTPPAKRLSVKTFVIEANKEIIHEAVHREIQRGGQIYYLYNSVEKMQLKQAELQELLPDISIGIAHGQMHERELERVMTDFYHHRFQLLLCSTIVESGIDVPTANTIIIENAHHLGLAQLHQLRGRVGRSHHQAYAYLIAPPEKALSVDAKKRLEAIASLEELGSGFILATHDMEIRGAGEILGKDQSGQMEAIGFTLYMELLDRAVRSLKKGESFKLDNSNLLQCQVELRIPALFPEAYMPDVHLRLMQYKRLASCTSLEEIQELRVEMIDRFGALPPEATTLFKQTEVKLAADAINIKKIEGNLVEVFFQFGTKVSFNLDKFIQWVQLYPRQMRLSGSERLKLIVPEEKRQPLLALEFLLEKIHHIQQLV